MGIKDVGRFNTTLLAKWKWRIGVKEEGVWRNVLESWYDSWRNMRLTMDDNKSSTWWKDLCKVCHVANDFNWFDSRITWRLGNERGIRFWKDKWVGNMSLKNTFLRLYFISLNKDNTVNELSEGGNRGNVVGMTWGLF